jgi:hypothetical protein
VIRTRRLRLLSGLCALTLLPSCGASDSSHTATSTTVSVAPAPTSTTVAAPVATPGPRTKNWFDLEVGDCVTEIPAIDVGAVTTTVVDCATPHQAEVYLLAPLAVNTAIGDVADQKCTEGFFGYTGRAVNGSPYSVAYLIDSNQDRTANNPTPSTAICFLQAANGGPLTVSAHH